MIRCPQCGMINRPDDIGYPRCGNCHEDLVRCAGCRHHKDADCRHVHGLAHFRPDGDGANECPQFRSRHEVREPHMLLTIPAPVWVSGMLAVLVLVLLAAAWFVDPAGRYFIGNPLRLETSVPAQVVPGEPFAITMRVQNLADRASTRIYLEIGEEFLARAAYRQPMPAPRRISSYRGRLLFEYDPLPAHGQQELVLPFTLRDDRTEPTIFQARVYAPMNQLRYPVQVPIVVGERPPGSEMDGQRGVL